MQSSCSVIIVTHNSEKHITKNIELLQQQTEIPNHIAIVDSGSTNTSYLAPFMDMPSITVHTSGSDVGFCRGNNIGMRQIPTDSRYVLFLNPDAFLNANFVQEAVALIERPENADVAILSGPLLGYDIDRDQPTGLYDSTGVFQSWYGRWQDRHQGQPVACWQPTILETVPAICGALMFCRRTALNDVLYPNQEVFDESFFMYKEDIDLSLRLRDRGWRLAIAPALATYHCRGWNRDRRRIPRCYRMMAARNELQLHFRRQSPATLYSLIKYAGVRLFDL